MKDVKHKIQQAVEEMKKMVIFDEKKHRYTDAKTGEWLQGVSTVSSVMPMSWLSAWGAKECVKALGYSDYDDKSKASEMLAKIKEMDVDKYHALLKESKGACMRKNKQALADGKAGHAWLESYVKAKINGDMLPPLPTEPLQLRAIKQFLVWAYENIDYWIVSEGFVCYPEKKYAGQFDGVAMLKNGKLAMIDFKFATHLGEDYYLQTAGYCATFEQFDIKFDTRILIRLPKTEKKEEYNKKAWKYEMIDNNLEVMEVPTPYELDRETFFACLWVKKWINFVEEDY